MANDNRGAIRPNVEGSYDQPQGAGAQARGQYEAKEQQNQPQQTHLQGGMKPGEKETYGQQSANTEWGGQEGAQGVDRDRQTQSGRTQQNLPSELDNSSYRHSEEPQGTGKQKGSQKSAGQGKEDYSSRGTGTEETTDDRTEQ